MTPLERLRYHVTGAIERGEGEAITELRLSWCPDCESTIASRWQENRKAWIAADATERDAIATKWHARLERLYNNTAMPESTFKKYVRLADNLFIGNVTSTQGVQS